LDRGRTPENGLERELFTIVAARCALCGHWFNPREMVELRMGGKWST
jgi:hypothetical protein